MVLKILYENEDWMPPLVEALERRNLAYEAIFVDGGTLDMSLPPEVGVYVNRMSPSSHTRGHQYGVLFVREYLGFLESKGVRVINGSQTFRLELSKVQQYAALEAFGIQTPQTIAVSGTESMLEAAKGLQTPFITKHNQGGKGLGVQLFRSHKALEDFLGDGLFEDSPDSINLLQQYIEPAEPFITRVEIVDGKFLYALQSSTETGFQLCPADACAVGDQFCPAPGTVEEAAEAPKDDRFKLRKEIKEGDPLVQAYLGFCRSHKIDVAGIEFVEDVNGNRFTYDINCTSNYNAGVEQEAPARGMDAIAALCEQELAKLGDVPRVSTPGHTERKGVVGLA